MKFKENQLAKLVSGFLFLLLCCTTSRADFQINFDVPPYINGSTIVGIQGWSAGGGSAGTVTTGIVTTAPWDANETVFRLNRSDPAGGTGTAVRVKNDTFTPVTGTIKLTVGMAFDYGTGDNGTESFFGFADNLLGPLSFGFYHKNDAITDGGGLFYRGANGQRVIILPKSEIKKNAIYEFTLVVDLTTDRFDITVTGLKANDTPFEFSAKSLTSGAFPLDSISLIFIANGGNTSYTTYVDSIHLQTIPEPGPVTLILGGAGVLLFSVLKKRHRHSNSA